MGKMKDLLIDQMNQSCPPTKPNILIGIPYTGYTVPIPFINSLLPALDYSRQYANITLEFIGHTVTHVARNLLVQAAIRDNSDYIMFIDSDQTFKAESIIELLRIAKSNQADGLAGVYYTRRDYGFPYYNIDPETKRLYPLRAIDYTWQEVYQCDCIPTGFTLFSRRLFSTMPMPLFWYDKRLPDVQLSEVVEHDNETLTLIDTIANAPLGYGLGEDFQFCYDIWEYNKTTDNPFKIGFAPLIQVGHIGYNEVGLPMIIQPQEQARGKANPIDIIYN